MRKEHWIYGLIIVLGAMGNAALFMDAPTIPKEDVPRPGVIPMSKEEHLQAQREWRERFMADTGWKAANSIAQLFENSNDWTGESDAVSDNATYARSDVDEGQISCTLRFLFDLSADVPVGATPLGVEVRYEAKAETGGVVYQGYLTSLVKGGTVQGDNKADLNTLPTTDTLFTKGGATDLWGLSLSRADVIATNFGFDLRFENTANFGFVYVDYGEIKVYYSEPTLGTGDATLPGFNGSGTGRKSATGSATMPGFSASGTSRRSAEGDATLPGFSASGSGRKSGSGSATLPGFRGKAHYRIN